MPKVLTSDGTELRAMLRQSAMTARLAIGMRISTEGMTRRLTSTSAIPTRSLREIVGKYSGVITDLLRAAIRDMTDLDPSDDVGLAELLDMTPAASLPTEVRDKLKRVAAPLRLHLTTHARDDEAWNRLLLLVEVMEPSFDAVCDLYEAHQAMTSRL